MYMVLHTQQTAGSVVTHSVYTEPGRRKFSLRIVTLMIYGQVFAENSNYMYRPVMTPTRAQRAPITAESVRGPRRAGRRL